MSTPAAIARRLPDRLAAVGGRALLAGLLLAVAGPALADCLGFLGGVQAGTVSFTPPPTITLTNNLPVGSVLWTSPPVSPTATPTLICGGHTDSGVVNSLAGPPSAGDDTLLPTNVPGLGYRLLHPDTAQPLRAWPNQAVAGGAVQLGGVFALQLVVTGTITPGSVLAGQLGHWDTRVCLNWFQCPGPPTPVQTFLTGSVSFVAPSCTLAVDPTVVNLPSVFASAFGGPGTVAGATPFAVQLNCQNGAQVQITLASNTPAPGLAQLGVIAATAGNGYAQNVGVQVLDWNGNPVAFGTAMAAGTATAGPFSIGFTARYYQTGAPVTGGVVRASATYTLVYP